jgi:hypothetical protein
MCLIFSRAMANWGGTAVEFGEAVGKATLFWAHEVMREAITTTLQKITYLFFITQPFKALLRKRRLDDTRTLTVILFKQLREQADLFPLHFNQFSPLLLTQYIQLLMDIGNFHFSLEIHLIIMRRVEPILCRLTILRHHDHRRLDGSQHGKKQIQEDVWIWIERIVDSGKDHRIQHDPSDQD